MDASTSKIPSLPAWSVLVVVLGLHFTAGGLLQLANPAFGIAFDEFFLFAAIPVIATLAANLRPVAFLALRLPPARTLAFAALAAFSGFFVAGGINAINRWMVGPEIARRYDVTALFDLESRAELVILVVGVSLLAPLGEELLFRGWLLRILRERHGTKAAVLVSSAVFAAIHFNPASILALFALGVVFALLRVYSGSLWPSILAHAVQNGTSSALVLSGLAAESPDELPLGQALLLVGFTLPFLLLALSLLRSAPTAREDDADLPRQEPPPSLTRRLALPLGLWAIAAGGSLVAFALLHGQEAAARLQRFFS